MGLSIRNMIYDEETGNLDIIPSSKFGKLFKHDPDVSLKEYSGRMVKYVTVIIQLEKRKPVSIIDMKFHIMKIDQNGKFDIDFLNELNLLASESISMPLFEFPENVIDISSDLAGKKFQEKYTWIPSQTIKKQIYEIIFGK